MLGTINIHTQQKKRGYFSHQHSILCICFIKFVNNFHQLNYIFIFFFKGECERVMNFVQFFSKLQ